jgi:hypothetical protein
VEYGAGSVCIIMTSLMHTLYEDDDDDKEICSIVIITVPSE